MYELKGNDLNLRMLYAETMMGRFHNFHNVLFSMKHIFISTGMLRGRTADTGVAKIPNLSIKDPCIHLK